VTLLQVAGLMIVVGLPSLVLWWKGRLRLSAASLMILAAAIVGVIAEAVALALIPVTGGS
jgi:hypothetical protein